MAYVEGNPRTKKQLKEWVASGRVVRVFQPGIGQVPTTGRTWVEGPHYPQPHTWYAEVELHQGRVVKVR